ncbi:MAG: CRISPR-associated protein Cas4 [Dictyoglomus thermophilum]|uniref:CRISPR-associated exonuclease Cas4 n=1 Tax=Dictyoglomus thermophilum TaxID=14 RepID=A0A7C2HA68_DICTH|nr:CRISPR-associated protein Cas4 [Dictyoglomus thermophilum]MCX7721112.1 CRISPR-associated protein Cas4 [Dictyoglomus thermophilum]TYT21016.1 CRISPR-associated protein Cas4 [Dictyoglomus thermophilum]
MSFINGTLIASYFICKRELWLMAHELIPDQENSFLEMGRFIEEEAYKDEEKGFLIGEMKIDIVKQGDENIIIGEIKKSSRSELSGIMQLSYYLMRLKEYGIVAKGEVLIPKERKKIPVEINEEIEERLIEAIKDINMIISEPYPPKPEKIKYCNHCAYKEFCWA